MFVSTGSARRHQSFYIHIAFLMYVNTCRSSTMEFLFSSLLHYVMFVFLCTLFLKRNPSPHNHRFLLRHYEEIIRGRLILTWILSSKENSLFTFFFFNSSNIRRVRTYPYLYSIDPHTIVIQTDH